MTTTGPTGPTGLTGPAGPWDGTYQVGLVVHDLDAAERHFAALGIGPFTDGPSAAATRREVYGAEAPGTRVRGRIARMGPIELELLQPVAGPGIQAEALAERGEHALHLCAYTDDLDAQIERMAAAGAPVISYGELDDGGRFAYFDTRAVGGLVLEYFQPGPRHR